MKKPLVLSQADVSRISLAQSHDTFSIDFVRQLIHELRHQVLSGRVTIDDLHGRVGLTREEITELLSKPILDFPTPYFNLPHLLAIWAMLDFDMNLHISPSVGKLGQSRLTFDVAIERAEKIDLYDPEPDEFTLPFSVRSRE